MMSEINSKGVVIKLIDGSTIMGKTNIGDNRRLSDRLNRGEDPFITVFDASVQGLIGKVLFINRQQIMWAMPVDDTK
jgi:hypothetical protein